jgi:hypothetical protein
MLKFLNKNIKFIANKCPTPPAYNEVNLNWTVFCDETKEHVDCINKKLKQCKKVQVILSRLSQCDFSFFTFSVNFLLGIWTSSRNTQIKYKCCNQTGNFFIS